MFYYIYKITNLLDGKIYIGAHQTENLDDGYFGSGKYLWNAIEKHGKENFKKEILEFFETRELMYLTEKEIVNVEFVKRKDTYNVSLGGCGGEVFETGTKEWYAWKNKAMLSAPNVLPKDDPKFIEWYDNSQKAMPQNLPKDDPKYLEWKNKKELTAPNKKPKDSDDYINWRNKQQTSLPQKLPKNDPRYIAWYENRKIQAENKRGKIRIRNLQLKKGKFIAREELETYLNLGWELGTYKKLTPDEARKKRIGLICIYNLETKEQKRINPEELNFYLNLGWKKGYIKNKNINPN